MSTNTKSIVILAYGRQPASFFTDASQIAGKYSVLDPDVARMAGATFAVGNPTELAALRQRLVAGAMAHERATNPGLSEAATKWLASGERGISSNFIFTSLTGIDAMGGWHAERGCHPHDPADFRRCQLLLEQVPELQATFHKMAMLNNVWDRLVAAWTAIIEALDEESPGWREGQGRSAPNAYDIIKRAIGR